MCWSMERSKAVAFRCSGFLLCIVQNSRLQDRCLLPAAYGLLFPPFTATDTKEYCELKECIAFNDRIRESVNISGSQPERLGSIIMTAVTALVLLISKVLDKARELSAKFSPL